MYLKLILPVLLLLAIFCFNASSAHESTSGSCPFSGHEPHNHHHHHHHGHHEHLEGHLERSTSSKLPEEFAEDEDLELYGFTDHRFDDHDDPPELSKISLWVNAMGCSLLVSMASLICLIILPVIFYKGKPSKTMVDSLALFGAGAMLGDAFLHQLPHAFGGGHSHSYDHQEDHLHDHFHHLAHEPSHSHSIEDLSIGLSVLSGIVLFLLVEKVVRYVEDHSAKGALAWGHGHHHHHHKSTNENELKEDDLGGSSLSSHSDKLTNDSLNDGKHGQHENLLRKRSTSTGPADDDKPNSDAVKSSITDKIPLAEKEPASSASSLVFGYLNLFSDGVHNFTDGMSLGSAFLLYGSVGGWSRTLFLLAHELPQEVGDFGILVRSGFSVPKALFFNFLSALVALAGTALALLLGKDPGQSSLIEGFTAGGFIYIAVAGVLPEMHRGRTTLTTTLIQLTALILGMAVALCISLVE